MPTLAWFDMLYGLVNAPDSPLPPNEDEANMRVGVSKVHAAIDSELARGTPASEIVLGGFSQGCVISLLSLLSSPHQLGGLACMSGWLPLTDQSYHSANGTMHMVSGVIGQRLIPDSRPASQLQDSNARPAPIFWGHGDLDTTIP